MAVVRTKKTGNSKTSVKREQRVLSHVLTDEEAWERYDARVRKRFGISADEFEAARAGGEFPEMVDGEEDIRVIDVLFLRAPRPE